jgi:hypothetical protein
MELSGKSNSPRQPIDITQVITSNLGDDASAPVALREVTCMMSLRGFALYRAICTNIRHNLVIL